MENILKKFDEAKSIAEKAIAELNKALLASKERRDKLDQDLKEAEVKSAELDKREKIVSKVEKAIKTQGELDEALAEVEVRLESISQQEKAQRAAHVKRENKLAVKEADVEKRDKELTDGLAKLEEDKKTYKEKIAKNMAENLTK